MATQEFVSRRDALDIVFANRNRTYGAYQLRRAYPRYLGRALGIGLLLIAFGLALPHILHALDSKFVEPVAVDMVREIGPPPEIDPELSPLPPPPPTPPSSKRPNARIVHFIPKPDTLVQQAPGLRKVFTTGADDGANDHTSEGGTSQSLSGITNSPGVVEQAVAKPDEKEYPMGDSGLQKPPTFPGGEQDLLRYLANNIKYPALARENNIQGTVALSFVVNKDGSVSDVSIVKEIGGGCGKESVRVVQSMPRWSPGEANGHPVKVRFTLPVRFRLQ